MKETFHDSGLRGQPPGVRVGGGRGTGGIVGSMQSEVFRARCLCRQEDVQRILGDFFPARQCYFRKSLQIIQYLFLNFLFVIFFSVFLRSRLLVMSSAACIGVKQPLSSKYLYLYMSWYYLWGCGCKHG